MVVNIKTMVLIQSILTSLGIQTRKNIPEIEIRQIAWAFYRTESLGVFNEEIKRR